MHFSEFKSEDYLKLKWHFVLLVFVLTLVAGLFVVVNRLNAEANRQLTIARGNMSSAQTALDQIEQEETTITAYIERYRAIDRNGLTQPKDPIDMLENVTRIRSAYDLFPVQMTTGGLGSFALPYDTSVYEAGEPVLLETSTVDVSLPLLHENDLANFIDSLLAEPGLLVATSCELIASGSGFRQLRQQMNANCSFLWYTFAVLDEEGQRL